MSSRCCKEPEPDSIKREVISELFLKKLECIHKNSNFIWRRFYDFLIK